MGGKRELRRCMSLIDYTNTLSEKLLPPSKNVHRHTHVTSLCPIAIHVDSCSDDSEVETDKKSPKHDHVRERAATSHRSGFSPGNFGSSSSANSPHSSSPSGSQISLPSFLELPDSAELSMLKATAVRLQLRTRTSSFLEWQSKWLDKANKPPQFPLPEEVDGECPWRLTAERKERINHALDWLKSELREMKSMDQHLARQLLSLRHDIHQLRLRRSCQQHRDLLDDVQSEFEEQVELSDVLDLPNDLCLNDTPLKQIGVTRMNISARRFSTC